MRVSRLRQGIRRALLAAAAAAVLAAPAAVSAPVHAAGIDPEFPRASVELRVFEELVVYERPDPSSPIATRLAPFSVVAVLGYAPGADGQQWVNIGDPTLLELGWVPLSKLIGADPIGLDLFEF